MRRALQRCAVQALARRGVQRVRACSSGNGASSSSNGGSDNKTILDVLQATYTGPVKYVVDEMVRVCAKELRGACTRANVVR